MIHENFENYDFMLQLMITMVTPVSGSSEPPSILKEMFLQAMELHYRATNEKMVGAFVNELRCEKP